MALVLNEEQTLLRDSARNLITDKAPIAHFRKLRDDNDPRGYSPEMWKTFAEMGFCGLLVPEEFGGSGLGHVEAGIVAEEIGHTLLPSPFLASAVLTASAIARGGSKAQKQEHLPKIAEGKLLGALAIDEGAKHRPQTLRLKADVLVVAARTSGAESDRNGVTLFLVSPKAKGVAIERTIMVDAHNSARINFSNVELTADNVLGEVDQGRKLLDGVLNAGRAVVASEMLGVADEAFARTAQYLKERKQFGKLIGEFQALQHRISHLYVDIEVTRAAILKALQSLDEDYDNATGMVAVAKARAGTTGTLAVQEALQMHGGIGMTDQFDIGLFMKRMRVCQELFGDSNYQGEQLALMRSY